MGTQQLENEILAVFAPPLNIPLSVWADDNAYLSAESAAEPGKWKTLPYQKGMMDAFTDPEVEQVIVMKSARVGYTKIINNVIAYHIAQDPCPIMVVQPTLEDAEGYSKEEIAPMLRDTPILQGRVSDPRSRDSNNTIIHKVFPGGLLSMVGANSGRGFRRVSRRVVLFDEVDGYPASAGTEGDQIKLGIRRSEYYWNRKIGIGSTPLDDDSSRIKPLFEETDQRRYFVPCPHCDEFQYLKWGGPKEPFGIKWPEGNPQAAYYVCEHCGCHIKHADKYKMLKKGQWRSTATGTPGKVGFHIWAAYSLSPNATWGHLAVEFLESKDNPIKLKTFVNTVLGEVWVEDYAASIGAEKLSDRAESYDLLSVPAGGLLLTCGVDVQDNRLAVVVRAWGDREESWLVNYLEIFGDPAQQEVWNQLDSVLDQKFRHVSGVDLPVSAMAIDSGGHHTHQVYSYARTRSKKNVIAIKGSSLPARPALGKPTWQDINMKLQTIKKGVALFPVGTDTIKYLIYSRLKSERLQGEGVYHFPMGLSEEYYKQLTAEKLKTKSKNGFTSRIWVKPNGARNEALDCEVYAYAALQFFYTKVNRSTLWLRLKEKIDKLIIDSSESGVNSELRVLKKKTKPKLRRRQRFVKNWNG